MAIRKVDGGYVIASRGVWLPGCYEDERTARYAFRLPDGVLQRPQDDANVAMLATGRRRLLIPND